MIVEDSLKAALKQKAELLDDVFGLNKTINNVNDKVKNQDSYEHLLGEKINLIKTYQKEIENLKKLLAQQTESWRISENKYVIKISDLNDEVHSLKNLKDNLEIEIRSNV